MSYTQKSKNPIIPVRSLDSSSDSTFSSEYLGLNLAVVYLPTRSGPQGPKPLQTGIIQKIKLFDAKCNPRQENKWK